MLSPAPHIGYLCDGALVAGRRTRRAADGVMVDTKASTTLKRTRRILSIAFAWCIVAIVAIVATIPHPSTQLSFR